MPIVQLRYKPGRGLKELVAKLAKELPAIVAPQLTIVGRTLDEGTITEKEIIVEMTGGSADDVNAMDLHIVIIAHNFPERVDTDEYRKKAIIKGVRSFLTNHNRNDVNGFVYLLLTPIAFGHI